MNLCLYDKNDIKKMLFSELVLATIINDDNKVFYDELKKRLVFCGFNDEMMRQLIAYELEIFRVTKKKFKDYFINKKWWLDYLNKDSLENKVLPLELEKYLLYYNGEMSPYALTNSEIVSIYDEVNFILANDNGVISEDIKKECEVIASPYSKKNLKDEFIHRIEYIYKRELNIDFSKEIYNQAMRFFINESHILFLNKYNYGKNEYLWLPYSTDYFKYHNY